jgi:hypothetical protein
VPARRAGLLGGVAVVLATIAVVAAIRWAGPPIYDGDGWYHVKYAAVLLEDGIARTFPWFQESFLKDRFTDFNLAYHLLLIPFTIRDPLTGARIASVLFAATTMGLFWGTARALRVPWALLWSLALLAFAPEFTYRLTYTRPFVLAVGLAVAGTGAILLGKNRLALVLAFLYTHLHCSYHLLPCVALLHDVVRDRTEGEGLAARFRTTAFTLAGVAAGCVLTPYFPNNLHMWWVANVDVLRASWVMGDALRVGTEMLPVKTNELLRANLGVFAVFGVTIVLLATGRRASTAARTLLPVALGFLGLSFLSQRFVELWAPFTFLLAGVALRDTLLEWPTARLGTRRLATVVAVCAIAAGMARTVADNRAAAAAEDPPSYLAAAVWMKANLPAGATVFNLGWDEFPELFFADGTHNYLIGQDPTFMWATDPDRTMLWARIGRGAVPDLFAPIRETFRCRYVFVPSRYAAFLKLARRDPRFVARYRDAATTLFELTDRHPLVRDWVVAGPWPDPSRRWLERPLGSEPASRTVMVPRVDGFLDLDRVLELPPLWTDVCAVASATFDPGATSRANLGITTDDAIRVFVNGDAVFDASPYLHPAPGMPGGPPLSLSALSDGSDGLEANTVAVRFRPGANTVAVRTCRYGEDFGFYLLLDGESAASRPGAASTTGNQ